MTQNDSDAGFLSRVQRLVMDSQELGGLGGVGGCWGVGGFALKVKSRSRGQERSRIVLLLEPPCRTSSHHFLAD